MIWRCDLSKQHAEFKEEVLPAIARVLDTGVYVLGPECKKFEEEFAAYIGTSQCVGVANATDGLTLALMTLGIGPGDEVITTPFTAIPTVSAIIDSGAKPVFVDIDRDTYLLDANKALKAVTPRTKAVMPVHIFGNVFDAASLKKQLPSNIAVIEDAAQAHGASWSGVKAGALADIGVFSFYPTKNLGAYGDGGAIVMNSAELAARARKLRMFGMVDKDHIDSAGVNSRLDEVQAAILRIKLRRLDQMNQRRHVIANRYKKELPRAIFRYQHVPENVVCNYHVFVAEARERRDELIAFLATRDIQTNIYYPLPLSRQKALASLGYKESDFPVAEEVCRKIMAFPMYPEFPEAEQQLVIDAVNEFFGGPAKRNASSPQTKVAAIA
jgi:dTDP-4-amino-4,6-dideoxygalactose transaminase